VLITGEKGTGKKLVAENIHYLSSRASRPYIDVNCAAIPVELIESELFGYEKGAFAGADRAKKGKLELAQGGTLFINEIPEMSLEAQSKLLTFLQNRSFSRAGSQEVMDVDVRIIAATSKNILTEVKKGSFLEDLYHRLSVMAIHLDPLRDRREDIAALVSHFGEQFSRDGGHNKKIFTDSALENLKSYSWPGNVRELRNFVERLYILVSSDFIDTSDLRLAGLAIDFSNETLQERNFRDARAEFEREYLLKKLSEFEGNVTKTAEAIGLERSYLHRKIKSYGIEL
jgi:two-component system nitrogen regulation response regulator NtrX